MLAFTQWYCSSKNLQQWVLLIFSILGTCDTIHFQLGVRILAYYIGLCLYIAEYKKDVAT